VSAGNLHLLYLQWWIIPLHYQDLYAGECPTIDWTCKISAVTTWLSISIYRTTHCENFPQKYFTNPWRSGMANIYRAIMVFSWDIYSTFTELVCTSLPPSKMFVRCSLPTFWANKWTKKVMKDKMTIHHFWFKVMFFTSQHNKNIIAI